MRRANLLTLVALVAFVGCSGGDAVLDDPSRNPGSAPEVAAKLAAQASDILRTLGIGDLVPLTPTQLKAGSAANCFSLGDVGLCASGSALICFAGARPSPLDHIEFTACERSGQRLDGSVTFSPGSGPGAGSVTFDVRLGGRHLSGTVEYARNGSCLDETFNDVSVAEAGFIVTMNGALRYCTVSGWPKGRIEVDLAGDDADSFRVELVLDGTPNAVATVMNLDDGQASTCEIDLLARTASCSRG